MSNELMRRHTFLNCERKILFVRQLTTQSGSRVSLRVRTSQRLQLMLSAYERVVTVRFWSEADVTQRLTQRDTLADEGPENPREDQKHYCRPAK